MSTLWSQNSGPDAKTVYLHDNLTLQAPGGKPINPFEIRFHMDTPFDYDPASGHLAMYIKPTPSGQGGTRNIDAQSYANHMTAPAAAITSNFIGPAAYGLITEFSWTAIPEPKSGVLMVFGAIIVFRMIRRKAGP
jgi:hypothetical protein